MTWFKIDDGFYDHPKVVAVLDSEHPAAAIACWTLAGTYCARHLTDGFISSKQLRRLCADVDHVSGAAALVDADLWVEVDGGYQFHQWTDHQPTRDEVEAKRKRDRDRVAKYRAKRRKSDADEVTSDGSGHVTRDTPPCNAVTDDSVTRDKPVTSRVSNGASNGTPARPGPTRPDPTSSPKPPIGGEEEAGQSEPVDVHSEVLAKCKRLEPMPETGFHVIERASELVLGESGSPVIQPGQMSGKDRSRIADLLVTAEPMAKSAGETTLWILVDEWVALAKLIRAGKVNHPGAIMPYFHKRFGSLRRDAIKAGVIEGYRPKLVPVEAAS